MFGHAGGEIAAAEAGCRGHDQHQPKNGVSRLGDEIRQPQIVGDEKAASRSPWSSFRPPNFGHGKSVGKPHQRADQVQAKRPKLKTAWSVV